MRHPTPFIGRRSVLAGLAAGAAGIRATPAPANPSSLHPTPKQDIGPYYPVEWTGDIDNDLVRVHGEAAEAMGEIVHLSGRILGVDGAPLPGAAVEIWQCDANGVYRHPDDVSAKRSVDPGFQGRGKTIAGADGQYAFRTIRPVRYEWRTPHVHFRVSRDGVRLLDTQMYVAGDRVTNADQIFMRLSKRDREAVTVRLDGADQLEPGAKAGVFDIVVV